MLEDVSWQVFAKGLHPKLVYCVDFYPQVGKAWCKKVISGALKLAGNSLYKGIGSGV